MRRALVLLVLVALMAVTALALATSAAPPSSGDWTVSTSESYSGDQLAVRGNVNIIGNGHLSMTNCDLSFSGTGPFTISVTTNARLTISGGTISSSGGTWGTDIRGNTQIDGTTMTRSSGLRIFTWKAKITNCSVVSPQGNGIYANPLDTYSRALDISDNHVTGAQGDGIFVNIGSQGTTAIKVVVVGNNASNSRDEGVEVRANTDNGRFHLSRNEAYLNGGVGLLINLNVRVIEFRIDDSWAKNNTDDGIQVTVDGSTFLSKYIRRINSTGNGDWGVRITFTDQHWINPEFSHWHIYDNVGGGLYVQNLICATLEDSFNVNDNAQSDYESVNCVLEIYRTTHRKARARAFGSAYHITSYRYLNLYVTWQNGEPCRSVVVDFEDSGGENLWSYTSDQDGVPGWLGNSTEWEWSAGVVRTRVRTSFATFMRGTGGQTRLTGPTMDFDHDMVGTLKFYDILPPNLKVETPPTNHVQNTDNLTITGSSFDYHSGAYIVQVSFDKEEQDWRRKTWQDAEGTSSWRFYLDPAPDGVYSIFVRSFDRASWPNGDFSNITILNVTVDTTFPNLTLIQPLSDIITNQTQIFVLGHTDGDVETLTLNGEPLPQSGGTFSKAVYLNEGINNIVIIATDYAGNMASVTRKITRDSIKPILLVSHPDDGVRTNKRVVTMAGYTDVQGVNMTIDGEPVVIVKGTWTHIVNLTEGPNVIVIDVVDSAKNHNLVEHHIYYDNVKPHFQVIEPKVGAIINTSVFRLLGNTASDVKHSQISVNGVFIEVVNGVFDTDVTVVTEGEINVTLEAWDIAGNYATLVFPVIIDTRAPVFTELSLRDGEVVNVHQLDITGSTEPNVTLYVDGKMVPLVDGHFSTKVNLDEGENTVLFRLTDLAGNTRQVTRLVTLDTVPPDIYLENVLGDVVREEKDYYTLQGTTEATSTMTVTYGPEEVSQRRTEVVLVGADGGFTHSIILGENKTAFISVRAEDYAGNVRIVNFTVERQEEQEPGYLEEHPEVLYGVFILVLVLVATFFLVRHSLKLTYERRLKRMGVSVEAPPEEYAGPAPAQRVPRPPGPGEQPRAPPRPPRPEEAAPRGSPRPPRKDE